MNYKKTILNLLLILLISGTQQNIFAQCTTDSIPPIAICDTDLQISTIPDLPTIVSAFSLDDGSNDNCTDTFDLQFFISTDLSLTSPPTTTAITYPANSAINDTVALWVVDLLGNSNSCIVIITSNSNNNCLQDSIAPIAICQGPLFINLGPTDDFSVTADIINNGSSDNCTSNSNLLLFVSDGSDPNPYQNIVTYPAGTSGTVETILTVVDEAGNESNCIVSITITQTVDPCLNDSIAPVMQCQGDIILPYTGLDYIASGQSIYDFQSVSDNCTPNDSLIYFIAEGVSTGPPPTTDAVIIPEGTVGWTWMTVWVVDQAGNFTSCSTRALVETNPALCVTDTIAPVANCTGHLNLFVDFTLNVNIPAIAFNNGSSDNCTTPPNLQFFITNDLSATSPPSTTELIYPNDPTLTDSVAIWVVDEAGNSSFCISSFSISDIACMSDPPVPSISCQQSVYIPYSDSGYVIDPLMIGQSIGFCELIWYDYYISTDVNFPALQETLNFPAGTTGWYPVSIMEMDDNGNSAICTTNIYFEPDSITCAADTIAPNAICRSNITMANNQLDDFQLVASRLDDGSTDNCTAPWELEFFITLDSTLTSPPNTTELTIPAGTNEEITVYLWVVDNNGNYSVCSTEVLFQTNYFFNAFVFRDQNSNCVSDSLEQGLGLGGYTLRYTTDGWPGVSSVQTNMDGLAGIALPGSPGLSEMTVELILPTGQSSSCVTTFTIDLTTVNGIPYLEFPVELASDCDLMTVDIGTAILRRCLPSTYSVSYCNGSDYDIDDVEILVTLPPSMVVQSAGLPYTDIGNNQLLFEIGTVTSGDCNLFSIVVVLDCNTPLGATKCVQAEITPFTCDDPLQSYTGADLAVTAACSDNDQEVRFTITNQGPSGMQSALDYIVIEDVIMYMQNPIQLGSGQSVDVTVPANGSTWRIEIPQPAGHPSLSTVSTAIEGCVEFGSMGFINQFSQADADLFLAIDCNEVVGSFDPNDKRAFPEGVGTEHFIDQNISLEYNIRFQNTGTDTAFTVRVEDQLDANLDFSSVQAGTSSHPYRLEVQENGKLVFHFENINLPDSTANEAESHGFVQFRVNQLLDNPIGTVINNTADIYFDFNEAIVTNTVQHIIGEDFVINGISVVNKELYEVLVAPNPANQFTRIQINHVAVMDATFELYNLYGQLILVAKLEDNQYILNRDNLPAGSYVFSIRSEAQILGNGKLIFR